MNCAYHPEVESAAFCVSCGNALCAPCRRLVEGSVYCENCLGEFVRRQAGSQASRGAESAETEGSSGAHAAGSAPYARRQYASENRVSIGGENPGAAFALGLIPGVGAIYNGEFFKAAVHIVIFGLIVSLSDAAGPASGLFALLGIGFYCYMPFEAYYTAKKRKLLTEGIDLETPIDRFHQQFGEIQDKELWGGLVLVALGVLFLADSFRFLPLRDALRYWPLGLIAVGVWLVMRHRDGAGAPGPSPQSSVPVDPDAREERREA